MDKVAENTSGELPTPIVVAPATDKTSPAMESVASGDAARALAAGNQAPSSDAGNGQITLSGRDLKKIRDRVRKFELRNPGETHPDRRLLPESGEKLFPLSGRDRFPETERNRREAISRANKGEPAPLPPLATDKEGATSAPTLPVESDDDVAALEAVTWTPDEVAEITDEVTEWLDAADIADDLSAARKRHLADKLLAKIENDAGMPSIVKKIFKKYVPPMVARKLNAAKVDPANKEGGLITLGLLIWGADKASRRFTIHKLGKENQPPAEPVKPATDEK